MAMQGRAPTWRMASHTAVCRSVRFSSLELYCSRRMSVPALAVLSRPDKARLAASRDACARAHTHMCQSR